MNSYVQVQPDSTGRKVETTQQPDGSGVTVERQVLTLGTGGVEYQLLEMLTQIRDELRALRLQTCQGMNVPFETTEKLTEQNT